MLLTHLAHSNHNGELSMEASEDGEPKPCSRHRRISDVFGCAQHKPSNSGASTSDYGSDDECSGSNPAGHHTLVSDHEDIRLGRMRVDTTTASSTADRMRKLHLTIGHSESATRFHRRRHRHSHRTPHLLRNNTVAAYHASSYEYTADTGRCSRADTTNATDIHAAIRSNTQNEPMSSIKALRIFQTVFANGTKKSPYGNGMVQPEHDSSCKHCVSEAMVIAHQTAGKGIQQHGSHGELRMNLGGGRNAVYVAPCEKHLECPLEKKGTYLVHTNKPKIMTDMSKVEFGICVDGWKRLVFKTVNDHGLAMRELKFYRKIASSNSDHLMRLLDDFTDNSNRHVMVFPRMRSTRIHGHDLFDIAYITRQLFIALRDLHNLGIAHLDITPTNMMSDSTDPLHIEVIDFGLACDITESMDGKLPSRGTCGFVAPEVLSGDSRDLRADIYSAGVVLGMMLQRYLPTINLRLLGGPLVRSDTTDAIVMQLDELLDLYQYSPEQVDYIECNTTYGSAEIPTANAKMESPLLSATNCPPVATPSAISTSTSRKCFPARRTTPKPADMYSGNKRNTVTGYSSFNNNGDTEEAAVAAAYLGGSSIFSSYGNISDDDDDDNHMRPSKNRFSGYNMVYGRTRAQGAQSDACGYNSPQYSVNQTFNNRNSCAIDSSDANMFSEDYGASNEYYYRSPQNSPVHQRESGTKHSTSQSNARYTNDTTSSRRSSASRTPAIHITRTAQVGLEDRTSGHSSSGMVGQPGRVPLAVLHAADLLRWTLQSDPQWRPTAAQVLTHPLLRSVEIKRWRQHHAYREFFDTRASSRADSGFQIAGESNTCSHQSPAHSGTASPAVHGHDDLPSPLEEDLCLICTVCGPPEQTGTIHTCVHGSNSIVSECNTKASTPVPPASPVQGSDTPVLCAAPATAQTPARRGQGMFKDSAPGDIGLWESEMYKRMTHGDRMDCSSYSSSSHDYSRDAMSSMYTSNGNYNDLTSYFY
ncbi:kinase-like protein [Coemansia reversa NRRL 1564]|uniref:Kinase-like protein n=1 Tax=Coemansia reversa (strain ATCC 12441 / NRRL 1564) TaxID=763665 RepID=A0A2G5B7I1_COERN|nr:kinase-like protein [Coemansia reversa NRRL 1564]|eukprot:PIA14959.1 kinase-like protein [Coemansia reversa NRRL 1564]